MTWTTSTAALRAAGFIGTWDTDVAAGRSVLDAGAAGMLAGDAGLAGTPLALDVALGRIHPEDRDWVFGRIRHLRRTGGPVSLEFRILLKTGETRWILNRGRLAPDATGTLWGCGAYLDITDLHSGPVPRPEADLEAASAQPDHLDAAADHAIQAHAALQRHADAYLQMVSGQLLLGIGRALARRPS
ncbi:MAG: PAS domain-containing protein [Actinomycetospora chiangmaiensis]|jgi:hypothetical protein|nr:PAS domain-containing protein [Actinomycetospora chiangmaiensis]